jgi:hypothetical protein
MRLARALKPPLLLPRKLILFRGWGLRLFGRSLLIRRLL